MEIPFKNSRDESKISKFTHSLASDRHQKCDKAASCNACIMEKIWHTVLFVLASICFGIDKQISHVLAFMSQVNTFNT